MINQFEANDPVWIDGKTILVGSEPPAPAAGTTVEINPPCLTVQQYVFGRTMPGASRKQAHVGVHASPRLTVPCGSRCSRGVLWHTVQTLSIQHRELALWSSYGLLGAAWLQEYYDVQGQNKWANLGYVCCFFLFFL
jgi:hypothetical protein